MKVIGVTGGICSGKSTVTKALQNLGIHVLDADKLGHRAYEPGSECYRKLIEHFGAQIVAEDGQINRPVLGSIVFSEPAKMKDLQNIVWPEIRVLIAQSLHDLDRKGIDVVVLEAAVMIEAGWQDLVSTLWVINVDKDVALKRLMKRNGLSEVEALKRIDSQLSNEERVKRANLVLDNSSPEKTVDEFEREVVQAFNSLTQHV